jgi:hypothetical protein
MKSARKTVVLGIVTIALLLIWGLHQRKRQALPVGESLPMGATQSTALPPSPTTNQSSVPTNPFPAGSREADRFNRLTKMETAVNVPIAFYGKFIDQYDQPVAGVRVEVAYNYWNMLDMLNQRPHDAKKSFYSSAAGLLEVKGIKGSAMDLKIEKEGYELEPHARKSFAYGYGYSEHFDPDPANPVLYHMWKRQGAPDLINQGFEKKVRADGTPISLDLQSGKFVIGAANLPGPTVRVWRDPLVFDFQTALPKEWRYELMWPNGKICAPNNVFFYLAPENGYIDKWTRTIREGDPDYRFTDKIQFYFVNEKNQFGRGTLEILADRRDDTALVALYVSWNPDGSRNLEPKPY